MTVLNRRINTRNKTAISPGIDSTVVLPVKLGRGREGETERLMERVGDIERRGLGRVKDSKSRFESIVSSLRRTMKSSSLLLCVSRVIVKSEVLLLFDLLRFRLLPPLLLFGRPGGNGVWLPVSCLDLKDLTGVTAVRLDLSKTP